MNCKRDVSLYFHIPFCSKKCPYCHFFVLPNEPRFKDPFLTALLQEWELRAPELQDKQIVSIYFGGGTPTKLPPEAYALLLERIHASVHVAPGCEITLEANPEDVTPELMQAFERLGINRVSLGVQSLADAELVQLGRTHDASRAVRALETAALAGISNLSIDLMFELPGQRLSSWEKTLSALKGLPITHLSLYNLTIEPHTVFFKERKQLTSQLPSEEERLQMLQMAVQHVEAAGLSRYEISAFARPGAHSRHNVGYWTGRPFIGLGPSAFSYWEGARFSNTTNFNLYLTSLEQGKLPTAFTEKLAYPSNLKELLAVQLRLVAGVDLSLFTQVHGPLPSCLEASLVKLLEKGWIQKTADQHIQLTCQGQLFYDSVASEVI